ncbi:MAG: O-antigen ligase family protein [Acidobacteriota bacterium]
MAKKKRRDENRRGDAGSARADRWRGPTLAGLWLLILLPPVIFLPGLKENFRLPKQLLSEVLALLALLLLAVRLFAVQRVDWRRVLRHPAVLAVSPLVLVALLGLVTSDHTVRVRQGLVSLGIGAASLVAWSLALSRRERWRLLRATAAPAILLSVVAILQFHGLYEPFRFEGQITERLAVTSLAGSAFDLAAFLLLPLLVAQVALLTQRRSTPALLGWGAVLVTGCWALLASQTLTVLVAFGIASLVLWLQLLPARRLLPWVAGLTAVAVAATLLVTPLRHRLEEKASSLGDGEVNRFLTGRLDGWRAAWWMFREHPVAGVGHGAYRAEFGTAKLALAQEGVSFFRGQHQVFFTNAHNEVLEVAAETGILGLAALGWGGWLLWGCWRRSRPRIGPLGAPKKERALASAVLVAMALVAATNFPFRASMLAFPWILFLSGLFVPWDDGPAGADPGGTEDGPQSGDPGQPAGETR